MPKLFMCLLGCTPPARNIEQHDVFFGIGENIRDLIPGILEFWPEGKLNLHLDAWREVKNVDDFEITVSTDKSAATELQLFFINLGGYKKNEFEEYHYKMILPARDKQEAIQLSKQSVFFRHTGFAKAPSHVDNKFGIDVDDIYAVPDILPAAVKTKYFLSVRPAGSSMPEDELHLGYFPLDQVEKWANNV